MLPNSSGRDQPALRAHRVGELLPLRHRLAADLSGRVDLVLFLDGRDDLGDGDAEFGELVRLHPDAHGVLARAEHLDAADRPAIRRQLVLPG